MKDLYYNVMAIVGITNDMDESEVMTALCMACDNLAARTGRSNIEILDDMRTAMLGVNNTLGAPEFADVKVSIKVNE